MQLQYLKSEIPEERFSQHVVFIVVVQMPLNRSLKISVRIRFDLFEQEMEIGPRNSEIFREDIPEPNSAQFKGGC